MGLDLISIGILLTLLGFFALIVGVFLQAKGKVEGGAVVFIGPIPIIGATSERMMWLVLSMCALFFIFFILSYILR